MTKFTEHLWHDLAREHGPALAQASRPGPSLLRRPGVIAGSTLVLAAGGTALALGLTTPSSSPAVPGGTGAVTAAYHISTASDGSLQVQINQDTSLPAANRKLTQMGIHEQVGIDVAPGPATVAGPVTCTVAQGVSGPALTVLLGTDGTEVIAQNGSGTNTGAGTWHLASCVTDGPGTGSTGNTGAG